MIVPPLRTGHGLHTTVLTLVTILMFVGLTYGDAADACTCAPLPPPAEALGQSDAVFAGEVLGLSADRSDTWVVARVAVADVWKGEVGEEVDVRTAAQSATCGYSFEVGRADLVYASTGDDGGFVTRCVPAALPSATPGTTWRRLARRPSRRLASATPSPRTPAPGPPWGWRPSPSASEGCS